MVECEAKTVEINTLTGCLLRVFWLLVGNIALIICTYLIAVGDARTFFQVSFFDALFWFVAFLLVISRFIDIRYYQGATTEGVRASMAHFRIYFFWLWVSSWGLWILAHALSYSNK